MSAVEYHYRNRRTRQNCIDLMSVLEEYGPCTRRELELRCHMGKNQVLRCIQKLKRDSRIVEGTHNEDARKAVYLKP